MPLTLRDLAQSVRNALRGIAPKVRVPRIVNKAYEAYCFALLFDSLRGIGYAPIAEQLQGRVFIFPGGPRPITTQTSSFVRFTRQRSPAEIELHMNLYARGTSGHPHEMDIAIIGREDAQRNRNKGSHIDKSAIWFAAECKCHDSRLGAGIGREFLGLVKELGGSGQYFALMTTYPWRRAAFDIVRSHRNRFFIVGPNRQADTSVCQGALRTDLVHLLG